VKSLIYISDRTIDRTCKTPTFVKPFWLKQVPLAKLFALVVMLRVSIALT
jgi:hypothetical protein